MPIFDRQDHTKIDHLALLFANIEDARIGRGELERLRAIEREMQALKHEIGPHPLETVLLQGEALADVFKLL